MNNLREKFNSSVAGTIADIKCNSNIDGNHSPEYCEREREDVMKALTNPIKLRNVTDTVQNIPRDVSEGIGSIMKMPITITKNLVNAGDNLRKRDVTGYIRELAKGVRTMITGQFAPVTNIGNRLATNVRNNQ